MMKRLILILLVLMLLPAGQAFAAPCAICGGDTGTDSVTCIPCMMNLLEDDALGQPLRIIRASAAPDASVTLTWTAAQAPYTVSFAQMGPAPADFTRLAAQDVAEREYTFTQLVPGVSYRLMVEDARGAYAETGYTAPEAGTNQEIGSDISVKPRVHEGASYRTLSYFSADRALEDDTAEYGVYVRLIHSNLIRARSYDYILAITAPNGFTWVIERGELRLPAGGVKQPDWGFLSVRDFFHTMDDGMGKIEPGDYTITLYFDGDVSGSDKVTVKP